MSETGSRAWVGSVCQLRSLQSSPWSERGARTHQQLTHLHSALVCVPTHAQHTALTRLNSSVCANCKAKHDYSCGVLVRSCYRAHVFIHGEAETVPRYTHIHRHNPHPGLKQKRDTSVLVSTWKLCFTWLIIMDILEIHKEYIFIT